ncbi:phenylalanine--tRNA ligase subunit alpha [Patescibacteria group bacterium]|nr:MAG: phenylalanine--tRNA ligase subunit alpha [Patescibacteria group bacterium]
MKKLDIKAIIADVKKATSAQELEATRVKYLGRQGVVTQTLREVGSLPLEQRKQAGADANEVRQQIEAALNAAKQDLERAQIDAEAKNITVDVTAPVDKPNEWGHAHPVLSLIDDAVKVFWQMGFQVIDGPEIETEWYNFEALNIPEGHPARDMQDTFYLEGGNLPRTHTSNLQIRFMEDNKPPIRVVSPGKVYRNEDEDARHVWMFHQIEGLVVDEGITLADLKGTLMAMMQGLLGENTQVRLRPNYFPYVEPGVEMDATCVICAGKGCKTCSGTGWLELGGAGMVHPQVLRNVGIDATKYSGFAFGFGPERIAAIKHDVPDVREFWRPNLNFLEHF